MLIHLSTGIMLDYYGSEPSVSAFWLDKCLYSMLADLCGDDTHLGEPWNV